MICSILKIHYDIALRYALFRKYNMIKRYDMIFSENALCHSATICNLTDATQRKNYKNVKVFCIV